MRPPRRGEEPVESVAGSFVAGPTSSAIDRTTPRRSASKTSCSVRSATCARASPYRSFWSFFVSAAPTISSDAFTTGRPSPQGGAPARARLRGWPPHRTLRRRLLRAEPRSPRIDGVCKNDVQVLLDSFRDSVTKTRDQGIDLSVVLVDLTLTGFASGLVPASFHFQLLSTAVLKRIVLAIGVGLASWEGVTKPPIQHHGLGTRPTPLLQLLVLLALSEQSLRRRRLLPDRRGAATRSGIGRGIGTSRSGCGKGGW